MNIEDILNSNNNSSEVTTLEKASQVAKRYNEVSKSLQALAGLYDKDLLQLEEVMKNLKTKYDTQMLPLQAELVELSSQLTKYHMDTITNANSDELDHLKSIKLPYGVTLTSRSKPANLTVTNQDAYLAYAKDKGLVKVKEEVEWAKLKKQLQVSGDKVIDPETGEVIDFIETTEAERVYDIKWD